MIDIKGKKILIQGAGRGNLGFIKTAKKHGVYTIVTGLGGDYPCNPYADLLCQADISDPDAILNVAQEHNVDGAVICCSDTGLRAIGRCNDVLGLKGLSEESAMVSSNKLLMKERLISDGVRTARFFKIRNKCELQNAVNEIGYPVIIKATDLQGSRGINIVRTPEMLIDAFQEVMAMTKQDYCIVEEFIVGVEYGAQAFVYGGQVLFVLPHGDETMMCKTAVPIGHYMPYMLSDSLSEDTYIQVTNAIKSLGFDNCAVNVDLIERDGKAYIIELTGRVGANCLPELVGNYFGINYYEMILYTALGYSPLEIFESRTSPSATLARMVRVNKSGMVKRIHLPVCEDAEIHMFVKENDEVRAFTNCNDAVGEVIIRASDLHSCEEKMNEVMSSIILDVD